METKNSNLDDIRETLSQLELSIKKLEDQGVDVSELNNDLKKISEKLENKKEETQEDLMNIKKEASKDCIFLRKKVIDTLRNHIESMMEEVKS